MEASDKAVSPNKSKRAVEREEKAEEMIANGYQRVKVCPDSGAAMRLGALGTRSVKHSLLLGALGWIEGPYRQ